MQEEHYPFFQTSIEPVPLSTFFVCFIKDFRGLLVIVDSCNIQRLFQESLNLYAWCRSYGNLKFATIAMVSKSCMYSNSHIATLSRYCAIHVGMQNTLPHFSISAL